MANFLAVQNLTKDFGGLRAVDDFSLTVGKGEFVGLIGPTVVARVQHSIVFQDY